MRGGVVEFVYSTIANGIIKRTKTISSILQEFRDVRKSDNINNVSGEWERKNEQTNRLYTRDNKQGREIRQGQNSKMSIGNKSGIEKGKNNTSKDNVRSMKKNDPNTFNSGTENKNVKNL